MLSGAQERDQIYFMTHQLIDENQHKSYEDKCECSRINKIVNVIGGKPVIFIRYNKIKHKGNNPEISQEERLALLLEVVHGEISKEYYQFQVKIYQLFYEDVYDQYYRVKEEDITSIVCFLKKNTQLL